MEKDATQASTKGSAKKKEAKKLEEDAKQASTKGSAKKKEAQKLEEDAKEASTKGSAKKKETQKLEEDANQASTKGSAKKKETQKPAALKGTSLQYSANLVVSRKLCLPELISLHFGLPLGSGHLRMVGFNTSAPLITS